MIRAYRKGLAMLLNSIFTLKTMGYSGMEGVVLRGLRGCMRGCGDIHACFLF